MATSLRRGRLALLQLHHPPEARQLARRWGVCLPLVECSHPPRGQEGFYLWHDGRRLQLYRGQDPHGICLGADDFAARVSYGNALVRACGVTRKHRPSIVDAMAGLGTDAMTLAAVGCTVELFEREPPLWALLDDFLDVHPMPGVRLHCADSLQWLSKQTDACCDTLYLDPLFPERAKKALPGKAMQYVRSLVEQTRARNGEHGWELNPEWLASTALVVRERLVLKRRLRDPVIAKPAWQIKARTVRYDVYRGAG